MTNEPEILTPNQLREREEHQKAVRERWGGKMPVGAKHPQKVGGYLVAVHTQRTSSEATRGRPTVSDHRWKDMGTRRLYPIICKDCSLKFYHEAKTTKRCIGCRKNYVPR